VRGITSFRVSPTYPGASKENLTQEQVMTILGLIRTIVRENKGVDYLQVFTVPVNGEDRKVFAIDDESHVTILYPEER
jgi:hypothetical protein